MNFLEYIRKWNRKNFPDHPSGLDLRQIAERETDRDLQKPIQQLICDVHEECLNPIPGVGQETNERQTVLQLQRLVGGQKRMVSMMGRVALEDERTSKNLVKLTVVLVILTIVLVAMTAVLIWLTIVLVKGEA